MKIEWTADQTSRLENLQAQGLTRHQIEKMLPGFGKVLIEKKLGEIAEGKRIAMQQLKDADCAVCASRGAINKDLRPAAYMLNDGRAVCLPHYTIMPGALKVSDPRQAPERMHALDMFRGGQTRRKKLKDRETE